MTPLAVLFLLGQVQLNRLNELARNRDVGQLSTYLASSNAGNPFNVLKTGGAYVAGASGWSAKSLMTPDGVKYVVFSTPIIVEDAGELLFRVNAEGKLVYVPESDDLGMALDSHSFDLKVDGPAGTISVTDKVKCHWDGQARSHFIFRITPTLAVKSIVDPQGHPVTFAQAGGIVAVKPEAGNAQTYTISYSGNLTRPGFRRTITRDEACLAGAVWYPTIARRPATYDIAFHTPKDWTALAQGEEVSSDVIGNERVTRYKMDLPVVWFSASAGPYKVVESTIHGRRYYTMSTTMSQEQMELQNEHSADVIELYSVKFWPYPFSRWTSLDSPAFRGGVGALEAYSFATYPGPPGGDAHEPSHSWWGGVVDNDYLKSFWNESFANFSMMYFQRERQVGNHEERRHAYVFPNFYAPEMDRYTVANCGDFEGPAAPTLGYGKGAMVLQVLEDEIGPDALSATLHEFIRANPSRHIATWEEFEKVVDRVAGQNYGWFFDEWVRRPGLPNFALTKVSWDSGIFTGWIKFDGRPYRIDSDLLMRLPDGTSKWARVDVADSKDGDLYRFQVPCPAKPALVSLDPWGKVPMTAARPAVTTIEDGLGQMQVVGDPAHRSFLSWLGGGARGTASSEPKDQFLVGSPETLPAMKPLCERVGFTVAGDKLTYKGTTIDLRKEGAVAVVDLPGGGHCMIGLGNSKIRPDFGRTRLMLFDERGRMLRGVTDPIVSGPLAAKLP